MQFQSDILSVKLVKSRCTELTSLGAAFGAGLACGVYKSKDEIKKLQMLEKVYFLKVKVDLSQIWMKQRKICCY